MTSEMWKAIAIVVLAGCAVDDGNKAAIDHARCVVRAPAGMVCREYSYQYPDELNALAANCDGAFAEDTCTTDDALGTCRFAGRSLPDLTRVYHDYRDIPGFIAQCRSLDGTWESGA